MNMELTGKTAEIVGQSLNNQADLNALFDFLNSSEEVKKQITSLSLEQWLTVIEGSHLNAEELKTYNENEKKLTALQEQLRKSYEKLPENVRNTIDSLNGEKPLADPGAVSEMLEQIDAYVPRNGETTKAVASVQGERGGERGALQKLWDATVGSNANITPTARREYRV